MMGSLCENRRGMTLPELLIAISLIPIVLLGAGVVSLQTARSLQGVYQGGRALSEKEYVMSFLERVISNGVPVNGATLTEVTTPSCTSPGCSVRYLLALQMPGGMTPIYFDFTSYSGDQRSTLYVYDDNSETPTILPYPGIPISVTETIDLIETPALLVPFVFDPVSETVTIQFNFNTPDGPIAGVRTIPLRGGGGVA